MRDIWGSVATRVFVVLCFTGCAITAEETGYFAVTLPRTTSTTPTPPLTSPNVSSTPINSTTSPLDYATTTEESINWENEVDESGSNATVLSDDVADAVKFYLYRRTRLQSPVRQGKRSDVEPLFGSRAIPSNEFEQEFDPNLETKILIHGWLNSKDTDSFQIMKENYLRKKDLNVLVVDWSKLSYGFNYLKAAGYVPELGGEVARFIEKLMDMGAVPENIHLVGHSLGAHVAGAAGSVFKSKVARITGLDPALPNFDHFKEPNLRLDPTDAQFVDIIHTCAGTLGLFAPIGHVDFYPNGGTPSQPGCQATSELRGCSHGRSIEFFHESILTEKGFWGQECATWDDYKKKECKEGFVQMGEPAVNSSRGVFYLGTLEAKPFAVGKQHFFYEDPLIRTLYYRFFHGLTSVVDFFNGR